MKIKIPSVTCLRCGHTWAPRKAEVMACAKCHSPHWKKPKEQKIAKA